MYKDLAQAEQIDSFIWQNYRKMYEPEYFFGIDNNQDPKEKYDTADIKILAVFLSSGLTRSVSNTFNAINAVVHKDLDKEVFIDSCSMPEKENFDILTDNNIPWIFGTATHRPMQDFDIVLVSHAIMPEVLNIPWILKMSGFPLGHENRMKDPNIPLIFYGGATAHQSNLTFGPIGDGTHSLVDIGLFGSAEGILDVLLKDFLHVKKTYQWDLKKDKDKLVEYMKECSYSNRIYHPTAYRFHHGEDKHTITKIEKLDPRVPDKVEYTHPQDGNFIGFPKKIFTMDGEASNKAHQLVISHGCSGEGACTFCSEGQTGGCWKERSLEDLVQDMEDMKKYAAPNTMGFFSYNLNYYHRFLDLLKESSSRFPNLSMVNMRADVVASSPEYLKLAKKLGLVRVAIAVEGFGNRLRNGILNKNLSREQLMKAVANIFEGNFIMLKIGMIVTGQETQEDVDNWLDELREILKIRDEKGSKTSIQISHTPLIHYDQTPLRYLERITARNSYEDNKVLNEYIETVRGMGIRAKFNARGPGNYVEQAIMDLGRAGTEWLIDLTLNQNMKFTRHFGYPEFEKAKKSFHNVGIDPEVIFRKRSIDEIFPSDDKQFTTEIRLERWREQVRKMDFTQKFCLKTTAQPKASCQSCGVCITSEQIKKVTQRELSNESTVEDVLVALSESRHMDSSRIVVKMNPSYDFYSRNSLTRFITSLFLRNSEDLNKAYYSVGNSSSTWTSVHSQKGWFGGHFAFDLHWNRRVSRQELQEVISKVNNSMVVAEVVNVFEDVKGLQIKNKDVISYAGKLDNYSMSQVKEKLINFDWNVKVAVKVVGTGELHTEPQSWPQIKDNILFVPYKDSVHFFMAIPAVLNPYLVMSSILGVSHKKVLPMMRANIIDHGLPLDANCSCGRELTYSYFANKARKKCPICMGKSVLYLMQDK